MALKVAYTFLIGVDAHMLNEQQVLIHLLPVQFIVPEVEMLEDFVEYGLSVLVRASHLRNLVHLLGGRPPRDLLRGRLEDLLLARGQLHEEQLELG